MTYQIVETRSIKATIIKQLKSKFIILKNNAKLHRLLLSETLHDYKDRIYLLTPETTIKYCETTVKVTFTTLN